MVGSANKVVLNLDVQEDAEGASVKETYKLCYISVKVASADVQVELNYTFNGNKMNLDELDSNTVSEINPGFEKVGSMDTELVKFIERLNAALVAQLDACYEEGMALINAAQTPAEKEAAIAAAMEAYKALVVDISKLMDVSVEEENAVAFNAAHYPALYAANPDLLADVGVIRTNGDDIGKSFSAEALFLENIRSAASHEIVKKDASYAPYKAIQENYVYYESPYGIYYAWLKNYKYLPSKTK
jgi:hypothetical protein